MIKVRAASVNPLDWHLMRGMPYFVRILAGLRKPKVARLGVDVAGQVEAVGRKVTLFKPKRKSIKVDAASKAIIDFVLKQNGSLNVDRFYP